MQIIGHCRFSWLGLSDTGRELQAMENPAKVLWDPRRMAVRFHLFETLFLPSILAQTNRDFQLVLTTSKAMPQMYYDRLAQLIGGLPMFQINATDTGDIGSALKGIVKQSIETAINPVHFRVDDDDGLCATYIQRLRDLCAAHRFSEGTAISFPTGIVGVYDGQRMRHAPSFKPYIAIGLAFVLGPNYWSNPFQVQHRRIGDYMPNFMDPSFYAYHYTRHSANNTSGYSEVVHQISAETREINRLISKFPELAEGGDVTAGIDDKIAQAFPFTNGAKLRADLARHAKFDALAEEMGFL